MQVLPDFSAVITVYNKEKYIGELLKACLNLVEICDHIKSIVIIDDCSTDSSWQVVSDFIENCESSLASRFLLERLPVNSGPQQARIKGAELAKSEWMILVDGDDLIYPSSVANTCDYILENDSNLKNIVVVYGITKAIAHDVSFDKLMQLPYNDNAIEYSVYCSFFTMLNKKRPAYLGTFIRYHYVYEMRGNLDWGEDSLFYFRLFQHGMFLRLRIEIAVWRRSLPEGSRGDHSRTSFYPRLALIMELFKIPVYKNTKSLSRSFESIIVRVLLLIRILILGYFKARIQDYRPQIHIR